MIPAQILLDNYMDKNDSMACFVLDFFLAEWHKYNAYLGSPCGIISKLIQSPSSDKLNIMLMDMHFSAYLILPISNFLVNI